MFVFYRDLIEGFAAPYVTAASAARSRLLTDRTGWVGSSAGERGTVAPGTIFNCSALSGITHALGRTCTLENVIASARGPVPVDMETLIQNRSHDGRSRELLCGA